MKKLWIISAALLVLIPIGMWWFSAENIIKRRTNHLIEVLSISDGTSRPFRQAKVYSMNAMLADEVTLQIPDVSDANGTFDKQEMESAFSWICQNAKTSDFRVTDFREIVITGEQAKVRILVEGYLDLGSRRPADGSFDVTIHWLKSGDGWRYDNVIWRNR